MSYELETLNSDQLQAYKQVDNTDDNYYITGKAGTGKSYLLKTFVANTNKKLAIVAPTGIAALNVGGQTIHSFFGLSTHIQDVTDVKEVYRGLSDEKISILKDLDTLIIDEVSMVRVDIMDMIDAKLKAARQNSLPFGGVQILAFGDLYQLPPVVTTKHEETYFIETYGTCFFFGAPATKDKPFYTIELNAVLRQKDERFINILNSIREGKVNPEILQTLNTRYVPHESRSDCITIVPTNKAAELINNIKLAEIPDEPMIYHGFAQGEFDSKDLPVPNLLILKPGAQIIMLTNNGNKWVNGSIGYVENLSENTITVRIKEHVFKVDKNTWTKYKYIYDTQSKRITKKEVGYYTQFPLKLSYAITVHKSQGQTYETVEVDYSQRGAFTAGQTYVALSRCKNFDQLYLTKPVSMDDIIVSQEVIEFMQHGFVPKNVDRNIPQPVDESDDKPMMTMRPDGSIELSETRPAKKLHGRKFTAICGENKWMTPFAAWCDMMHVYEIPFKETKYTEAGTTIEPLQYEFVKKKLRDPKLHIITPTDLFGEKYKENTHFDFFRAEEIFGGMWDYLLADQDNKIIGVLEMKTTNIRNRNFYENNYPLDYKLQASLYAYLLGIKRYYMITSYLADTDYDHPENYICNDNNTKITKYDIDENFEKQYILQAIAWYSTYITGGISPVPDPEKDEITISEIKQIYGLSTPKADDQEFEIDEYYNCLDNDPYNPDDFLHMQFV